MTIFNGVNNWYRAEICMVNNKNATFKVYNSSSNNVLLWEQTITTNLPIGSAAALRLTGFGVFAGESTTDAAANIIYLDYMELAYPVRLNR